MAVVELYNIHHSTPLYMTISREEEQEKEEGEEEELSFLTFQNGDCLEEDQVHLIFFF